MWVPLLQILSFNFKTIPSLPLVNAFDSEELTSSNVFTISCFTSIPKSFLSISNLSISFKSGFDGIKISKILIS